ncbi:L-aspartate oxidase [Gordonia pseudamarae]|jgi:L-aspartate oxidase|uniref:L-aspartate oxidase n=1 Tax=Gordonia pseudamarae TaxID=2831662 RepID=A0ABX6ICU3_9ACTN|nr:MULTISPECIES: L-aspartate oxidase [Gordonia]MBD0023968.1 L-aspartate oxidase [Gordonia sp. (in: high G+C Gram-positive bacteria)]QHN24802.1 L-aspartate oxidase [Gordonia pseudamarae]QHN33735.1 L-aspartate oxidase [Gordonia pseudamarae]
MTDSADRADFVVVGAGIAGLTAAIRAAEAGCRVVVLNKGPSWCADRAEQSTSTFYAQGGVAVVTGGDPADPGDPADSVDLHLSDTLAAGAGLADAASARPILADGYDAVWGLMAWGAEFDRTADGLLSRTREGGHSVRRIIHAGGDATGAAIQRALGARVTRPADGSQIDVRDEAIATGVVVADGRAVGVRYLRGGVEHAVYAPTILLATGGAGHLYAATTNPAGATADGIALALRAGAHVADLEFIQFHPTMLYLGPGGAARGRRTLISEAVRGEGGRLVDVDGRSVTDGVHPLGDLAPRDVVANAVRAAIVRTGHPCVYLDVTAVRGATGGFESRFPTVTAGLVASGVDPSSGRIPVVPGAHYLCGGVVTDASGATGVPGLLAAGEVARTGLHGGNRLASNSLLEGLVVGRRAAALAVSRRDLPISDGYAGAVSDGSVPRVLDRTVLQDTMTTHVALGRDAAGLGAAAGILDGAPRSAGPLGIRHVEDAALTLTARAVIAAAAARTETRGSHVRLDHPGTAPDAVSHAFRLDGDELVPADLVPGAVAGLVAHR